jgi:hypothetical protein
LISDEQYLLYETIQGLHRNWMPHEVQARIAEAIFYKRIKNVFVCAGRNNGKTENAAYCTWRWGKQNPNSENYIFEPLAKQGREILWASKRIQNFGPQEWVDGKPNETEMRVKFTNGSFIKVEGSDNSASMAGIKPKGLIVYDEFKDHRPESITNFEPNRAAFDVPALFIGTPPEFHNHFVDYMDMAKNSPDWLFIHAPTRSNPHISTKWLERKRLEMIAMGMEEDWLREYEAIFVKGGKKTIYPQWLKLKYKSLDEVMPKDLHKWVLIVSLDPAATSIFGGVFFLYNPFSKKIIIVDEIYESEPNKMTAREINRTINEKLNPWIGKVKAIEYVYDEAAAYFKNEINEISPEKWLSPSRKADFGVEGYINLIRAALNAELIEVVGTCKNTIKEHEEYAKDDKGRIPKENDHIINCIEENQKIITKNGNKKIKDVLVGDYVLTRLGYKKVLEVIDNGFADTITIQTDTNMLTCTEKHLLWSSCGWNEAVNLKEGDYLCQNTQLSLMQYHGLFIQKANQKAYKDIIHAALNTGKKALKDICIDMSGSKTKVPFQKIITFIMLIITLITTTSRIFHVYTSLIITLNIRTSLQLLEKIMCSQVTWKKLGRYAKLGIVLKKVKNGILSTEKTYLEILSQKNLSALTAAQSLKQQNLDLSFALQSAKVLLGATLGLIMFPVNVLFVHLCSILTNTQQQERVQKVVKLNSNSRQKVYDLKVDGCNEFFAENILVHNCLQYGIASLGLNFDEILEPKEKPEEKRYYTFEEEFNKDNTLEEFE